VDSHHGRHDLRPGSLSELFGARLDGLIGPVQLRWRYTTDPLYHGRGVCVAAIRITAGPNPVYEDRTGKDAGLVLQGFVETNV